jgi:glycosyltransferase involved in cell wall biosynthesis
MSTELSGKIKGYLVLGIPQLGAGKTSHPGGQLTAASGLLDFLGKSDARYVVLNTRATTYPPVPLWIKLIQSAGRVYRGWRHASNPEARGYLAFSSFGLSLLERCAISFIFRIHRKPSLIFFRSTEILGQPMSPLKRKVLSKLLGIPSTLVSQGSLLAEELRKLGRSNVDVIPNWLPPGYTIATEPKMLQDDGVVNFVFVGWLERTKGVPELIEAAKILKPIEDKFAIYIAGNGRLEKVVAAEISKEQLTNVHQLGWVDKDQVRQLLDRAHVFVLPSHTEGFPNVLLEAMSHGLAVIATQVGAIPDVIKQNHNGMLVDVSAPADIAACMRRYISEKELITKHSRAAIETVSSSHRRDVNCEKLINAFLSADRRIHPS